MKDEKRVVEMDRIVYAIILNSLLSMKNELRQQEKETDLIDKVIIKIAKAPSKKQKGIFHRKKGDSYETR
jgi:hypothetical protein